MPTLQKIQTIASIQNDLDPYLTVIFPTGQDDNAMNPHPFPQPKEPSPEIKRLNHVNDIAILWFIPRMGRIMTKA